MEGAAVFAIIQGTTTEPRAAYLDQIVPLTAEIAAGAAPVDPTEVFRLSAPCAANGCCHFREGRCSLAARLVQLMPAVAATVPPCMLRPTCKWWLQEGVNACLRCPQVVTRLYGASAEMKKAATPPPERGESRVTILRSSRDVSESLVAGRGSGDPGANASSSRIGRLSDPAIGASRLRFDEVPQPILALPKGSL